MTTQGTSVRRADGTVVCIGGHEDRVSEKRILTKVAEYTRGKPLLLFALASKEPEPLFEEYEKAFAELGQETRRLDIEDRRGALAFDPHPLFDGAGGVFFTGGNQQRIASFIGGTHLLEAIKALLERGGVVAGTSAGASVVCTTMLTDGLSEETNRVSDLKKSPGLGLVQWGIIDQHFSERGRIGRLLAATAENPELIGIGVDEDTAIIIDVETGFEVLGEGGVYVIDASNMTYTNYPLAREDEKVCVHNVKLHGLIDGEFFDIKSRMPRKKEGS